MSQLLVNKLTPYTGNTIEINGLIINDGVLSATTYENLPLDVYVTGGTFNNGSAIFTNNTGGTFSVTGFTINGGGSQYVEVTYSDLVSAISGSTLSAGTYYIITDFRTCYDVPEYYVNGDYKGVGQIDYREGNIEPIIVLATSANTISSTAYQPAYPNDRIQYNWTYNTTEITSGTAYGRITERIDEFNNRTDYDHRNITFNRFQSYNRNSQLTGTISAISWGQGYLVGVGTSFLSDVNPDDILSIDGYQFGGFGVKVVSAITDTIISIVTDPSFGGIAFCGETYTFHSTNQTGDFDEYKEVYFGQKLEGDWDNFLTFNLNGSAVHNYVGDYSRFYLEDNVSNSGFLLANNVFYGNRSYSNTIGDRSYNNTATYWFVRNTIAGRFYNNVVHNNGFYSNSVGENFNENIINGSMYENIINQNFNNNINHSSFNNNKIGNGFNSNIIESQFYDNLIDLYFGDNNITQQFHGNQIGPNFNSNSISGETYTNIIGERFENNTIYGPFYDNQISNEFKGNITYQDFNINIVDWGFSANEISGYCSNNTFGSFTFSNNFFGDVYGNKIKGNTYQNIVSDSFIDNNIDFGFSVNTIGENFRNNEIGQGFNQNTIGEGFGYGNNESQKNHIGDNFTLNTVGDYFYNNRVSNYFINNTVGSSLQWNVIDTKIDSVDFTAYYGNITGFTHIATGTSAADNLYTGLIGSTNGIGVNASFDVDVSGGIVIGVSGNTSGKLFNLNDSVTILGSQIGGTDGVDDVIITITAITPNPSVYEPYTCNIFERQGGGKRLSYFDSTDVLTINNINE